MPRLGSTGERKEAARERLASLNRRSSQGSLVRQDPRHERRTHAAASSHVENAAYMQEFRSALADMERKGSDNSTSRDRSRSSLSGSARNATAARGLSLQGRREGSPQPTSSSTSMKRRESGGNGGLRLGPERGRRLSSSPEAPSRSWWDGPSDPSGTLVDASDRNLMCSSSSSDSSSSTSGPTAVFGCADHALYEVELCTGKLKRKLHSRSSGHSDWVTAVVHTAGRGDIVSGGSDGQLCKWPASGGLECRQVRAHESSISQLRTDDTGKVVSSGCGGEICLWNAAHGGALSKLTEFASSDNTAPVTDFIWKGECLLAGYRDGSLTFWDVPAGGVTASARVQAAHRGHVTATAALGAPEGDHEQAQGGTGAGGSVVVSGGQDGFVKVWDARCLSSSPCVAIAAHRSSRGAGAVGGLIGVGNHTLLSYGADRRICRLDLRKGTEGEDGDGQAAVVRAFDDHKDFIYSMKLCGSLLLSGGGDGLLLVHDLKRGKLLYGLGCCKGAVRAIEASASRLAVGGDDGNILTYAFEAFG